MTSAYDPTRKSRSIRRMRSAEAKSATSLNDLRSFKSDLPLIWEVVLQPANRLNIVMLADSDTLSKLEQDSDRQPVIIVNS